MHVSDADISLVPLANSVGNDFQRDVHVDGANANSKHVDTVCLWGLANGRLRQAVTSGRHGFYEVRNVVVKSKGFAPEVPVSLRYGAGVVRRKRGETVPSSGPVFRTVSPATRSTTSHSEPTRISNTLSCRAILKRRGARILQLL